MSFVKGGKRTYFSMETENVLVNGVVIIAVLTVINRGQFLRAYHLPGTG